MIRGKVLFFFFKSSRMALGPIPVPVKGVGGSSFVSWSAKLKAHINVLLRIFFVVWCLVCREIAVHFY